MFFCIVFFYCINITKNRLLDKNMYSEADISRHYQTAGIISMLLGLLLYIVYTPIYVDLQTINEDYHWMYERCLSPM